MTDCHDWFAELAEVLVRYLVSKAGFEVFGQSEWGADLAIHDRDSRRWLRCEVRSSDCKTTPVQKDSAKLANIAEIEATVVNRGSASFDVVFYKLDGNGFRETEYVGGPAVRHDYTTPELLAIWLRERCFVTPAKA